LSHAHIDHCGLIPRLVKEGFEGQIFCTAPTMDLVRILAGGFGQDTDAGCRVQQQAPRSVKACLCWRPLYTEDDVIKALSLFKIVNYHEAIPITPQVKFKFTDAGHVLGSAAVHLAILEDGKKLTSPLAATLAATATCC
jgi:metallo-beta-lactamase family protein